MSTTKMCDISSLCDYEGQVKFKREERHKVKGESLNNRSQHEQGEKHQILLEVLVN